MFNYLFVNVVYVVLIEAYVVKKSFSTTTKHTIRENIINLIISQYNDKIYFFTNMKSDIFSKAICAVIYEIVHIDVFNQYKTFFSNCIIYYYVILEMRCIFLNFLYINMALKENMDQKFACNNKILTFYISQIRK